MGTNFYAKTKPCEACGHAKGDGEVHIGKSSIGWVFMLNTHPKLGIRTMSDWIAFLADKEIVDEYGKRLTLGEMVEWIAQRDPGRRSNADEYGVRRGEGTWDYHCGDFS